jgi:hypothetical protein
MKKYFKSQTVFTLNELKQIVASNPRLGFYFPLEHPMSKDRITVHNSNNGSMGGRSKSFNRVSDENIIMIK